MRGQKYELPKPTNPNITFTEARESFELQGKLEKFKRFANNTKNPFLREQLFYRQHGICPYCNKPLPSYISGVSVHHNDYMRYCVLESEQMRVYTPYKKNRSSSKVPNCEICYFYFPYEAKECLANWLCCITSAMRGCITLKIRKRGNVPTMLMRRNRKRSKT